MQPEVVRPSQMSKFAPHLRRAHVDAWVERHSLDIRAVPAPHTMGTTFSVATPVEGMVRASIREGHVCFPQSARLGDRLQACSTRGDAGIGICRRKHRLDDRFRYPCSASAPWHSGERVYEFRLVGTVVAPL